MDISKFEREEFLPALYDPKKDITVELSCDDEEMTSGGRAYAVNIKPNGMVQLQVSLQGGDYIPVMMNDQQALGGMVNEWFMDDLNMSLTEFGMLNTMDILVVGADPDRNVKFLCTGAENVLLKHADMNGVHTSFSDYTSMVEMGYEIAHHIILHPDKDITMSMKIEGNDMSIECNVPLSEEAKDRLFEQLDLALQKQAGTNIKKLIEDLNKPHKYIER